MMQLIPAHGTAGRGEIQFKKLEKKPEPEASFIRIVGGYWSARTVMSMLSTEFGLRGANGACTKSE